MTFDLPNLTAFLPSSSLSPPSPSSSPSARSHVLRRRTAPPGCAATRASPATTATSFSVADLAESLVWDDLRVPHTYECPMRWADMDLLGHVNNVTYLDYVAEARERPVPGQPGVDPGAGHAATGSSSPRRWCSGGSPCYVDTWFTEVGEDSVTLAHEMYDAAGRAGWRAHASTSAPRASLADVTLATAHDARSRT